MASPSLRELLTGLHADRERVWDPAQLKLNADRRRELVEAADPAVWPSVATSSPTSNWRPKTACT